MREVIDRLGRQIELLVIQAEENARVDLRLDDLFDVVVRLTTTAKLIDAVDLEVNRWENDARARRYFAQNLAALRKGTKIRRVYVISPRITETDLDMVQATVTQHLAGNEDPAVRAENGRLEIGVIYHKQLAPDDRRDFAIFDNNKVLIEEFGSDWVSTFKGRLTKDTGEVTDFGDRFEKLWNKTERLMSPRDVSAWASKIRNEVAQHSFTHDVFIGYCSQARTLALELVAFIHEQGHSVRDWKLFPVGGSLLDEIDNASRSCRAGLFLFTKDDLKADATTTPRDNVVLECGYFLARKAPGHVFLVLEDGAKPPSDLDGIIRAQIADHASSDTIHTKLKKWLDDTLGPSAQ